jgi:hypothetical protein
MASPEIKQNLVPSDVQLQDLLDIAKKDIMMSLVCHHIGTVKSFDPVKQTATAVINYKKTYFQRDPQTRLYQKVYVDYPILLDCPCVVLGGGNGALTMPITEGDECLILFNDRDIDNWFSSGQVGPVATARLHSLSDALILVGVRSSANVIEDYDTERAVLRWGATMVGVGETQVKIANATTTLNTLLQDLITAINDLVTQTAALTVTGVTPGGGASGVPANAAAITAIGTQLTTLATDLGGLLE